MKKPLRVGVVQHAGSDNRDEAIQSSITGIRDAAKKRAQLILLQELHTGLYFCQEENPDIFNQAEPIPGPSTETFGALAKELGVVLVLSLFEYRAPGLYHNTAVVIERDGTVAGIYRKMHIPDDPGYYEKFFFTPGDLGFTPIQTSVGKLGVLVCWDQWFPEAARLMALQGAEILLYPTAIGWVPSDDTLEHAKQRDAWIIIQRSHAIANGLFVMTCNRVGHEASDKHGGIQFWGSSFIAGPQGEIIQEASVIDPQTLVTDIDLARIEQVRRLWPYFRDRRIDAYQGLLARYL